MATIPFWGNIPCLRVIIPLVCGIVAENFLHIPAAYSIWGMGTGIFCLLAYRYFSIFLRYRFSFVVGTSIFIMLFFIGVILLQRQDVSTYKNNVANQYKKGDYVVGNIGTSLQKKANSWQAEIEISGIYRKGRVLPTVGRALVYFTQNDSEPPIKYGDNIIVNSSLQEIQNSKNPGAFNYQTFLKRKGITHQLFIKPNAYVKLGNQAASPLQKNLLIAQQKIIAILEKYIPGENEVAIAEALLVGYKANVDAHILQSFSRTGVIHIIAISGMHLGIIYWILNILFQFLLPGKRLKRWRPILVIVCVWLFALLVGGQASIVRAAVVFTCFQVGILFDRKGNSMNTLLFSAILLLCYNPYWLFDLGFQLSYTAVAGILLFYPAISKSIYLENKIIRFFWQSVAVTIAAQILTFPIIVYYFHQFPLLFIVSNFVAVLLSNLLVGSLIICVLASGYPPLATFFGKIISYSISWLIDYIQRIDSIPFALWENIYLAWPQVYILFAIIAFFILWIENKRRIFAFAWLSCILLFACIGSFYSLQTHKQQKLVVLHNSKLSGLLLVQANDCHLLADSAALLDSKFRQYTIIPALQAFRIKTEKQININKPLTEITFLNQRILWASKPFILEGSSKQETDLMVVSQNASTNWDVFFTQVKVGEIIIDASYSFYKTRRLIKILEAKKIPFYSVNERGAFEWDIQ